MSKYCWLISFSPDLYLCVAISCLADEWPAGGFSPADTDTYCAGLKVHRVLVLILVRLFVVYRMPETLF